MMEVTNLSTEHPTAQGIKELIESADKQGIIIPSLFGVRNHQQIDKFMELYLYIYEAGFHNGYTARMEGK